MKFSTVLAFAGAAVAQSSFSNVTWTTEIVKSIVTYCPGPTQITHGGKTYTVTSATTLTITDCPCTVTKPVTKTPEVVCKTCNATAVTTGKPAPPPATVIPTGGLPPKPSSPVQAGAAKLSGAGLAVVLGAAILL